MKGSQKSHQPAWRFRSLERRCRVRGRMRFVLALSLFYLSIGMFIGSTYGSYINTLFRTNGVNAKSAQVVQLPKEERQHGETSTTHYWMVVRYQDVFGNRHHHSREIGFAQWKSLQVGQAIEDLQYLNIRPTVIRLRDSDLTPPMAALIGIIALFSALSIWATYHWIPSRTPGGSE